MSTPRSSAILPLVVLVLTVVVLVVQVRVVLGGKTWDDVRYHTEVAPPRLAAADSILAGELPTWWDGSGLGVPLLGEPSHGAAYPLTWFASTPQALDLALVAHLLWLALGIALWARRLGATEIAAVLGGVMIAASGIIASSALRGALPALAHLPWVGWAALGLTAVRARKLGDDENASEHGWRSAAALALALGAIGLAGQLAILVDAVALAIVIAARKGSLRLVAIGVGAGLAISALQWLPAIFVIAEGAGAEVGAMKLSRVLELVVPGSFGSTDPDRAVTQLAGAAPVLPSLFVGAPLFAFAALARPARRLAVLAGVFAILALVVGRGGWPAWLGAPELHLAVLAVIAAPHAAGGIDALLVGERSGLVAILGAGVAALLAFVGLLALSGRVDAPGLERALIDGALGVACLAGAALLAWRGSTNPPRLLAAILVVAPTVGALGTTAPVIERSLITTTPAWVEAAETARTTEGPLRVFRPLSMFDDRAATQLSDAIATLTGTSAARHGIAAARSEDPARRPIEDRVWFAAAAAGGSLLDRFGVPVAILPGVMVEGRGLVELARRRDWALVRYPASPIAAVITEWIWIADEAATIQRLFPPGAGRGLPAGLIVLRGQGAEQQDEPAEPEPCLIPRWTGGAIDLTCTAQGPAYAVVSSSPADGWTVHVDGKDTPWVTADLMRRAVPIGEGPHIVSWRYRPPGFTLGAILAALGCITIVALVVAAALTRRRRTRDRASRETN